jgi:ribosomal protein S21
LQHNIFPVIRRGGLYSIKVYQGEDIDRALKRLKTKLDAGNILEEVKNRRSFETKAQKKKRKQKAQDRKYKRRR